MPRFTDTSDIVKKVDIDAPAPFTFNPSCERIMGFYSVQPSRSEWRTLPYNKGKVTPITEESKAYFP